jgi:hypothetical protein
VTVEAPNTDGQFVNKDVVVEIYAFDSIELSTVHFELDGRGKHELTPVAMNSYQYRLDTTRFSDGNHTITVSAADTAGHKAVVVRYVNFDNTGPEITIKAPTGVQQGQVTFEVTAVDKCQYVSKVQLNIDGLGWREMMRVGNTSTYTYIWFTTEQMNGAHVFEIKATDALGNEAIKLGNVQIGNPAEVVTPSYVDEFKAVLPVVWFSLALVLIIAFILIFHRRLVRWVREDKRYEAQEKAWAGEEKRRRGLRRYLTHLPMPPPPPKQPPPGKI